MSVKKLIIIPTYNEKDNIAAILDAVFSLQQGFHVLVIDDGSPDGTAGIVKELQNGYEGCLFLQERKGKQGLGTAYIHGFKWALERDYDYVFEMDADFSHDVNDLDRLYAACRAGADVAVGSRYVKGGKIENWPLSRHIYSKGGAFYTRLITWMPVNDPTAGFVCYTRRVLNTINFDEIQFVGYAFQVEMKFAAWKLGFNIIEVPITFRDRKWGVSKMSKGILKEGILGVLKIQWQSLFKGYHKRVNIKTASSSQAASVTSNS